MAVAPSRSAATSMPVSLAATRPAARDSLAMTSFSMNSSHWFGLPGHMPAVPSRLRAVGVRPVSPVRSVVGHAGDHVPARAQRHPAEQVRTPRGGYHD